ncbi:MAG: sigma 54-interacting transcriptional regulator [Acidobacteriota bacterium]
MNPRLVALAGPVEGRTFHLHSSPFTLGRNAANDLQLTSPEVSRHHCELRTEDDGRYRIVDLGSRHGVLVNNRPVRDQPLSHSDVLTVGGSVLLFLLDAPSTSIPARTAEGSGAAGGTTVARRPTEVLYLDGGQVDAALPSEARVARDLHALLRVAADLQGPQSPRSLADRVLAAVLEVVPAGRVDLLLREPGVEALTQLASASGVDPNGPGAEVEGLAPDAAVLRQVRAERTGLLRRFDDGRTMVCSPLLDHDGELLGAVHAGGASIPLDERHLDLMGAIAAIASLAFQTAFHLRRLERENERLKAQQLEHDIVGESPPIRRLLDLVARVARADSTVLVRGESGTGKELTAQAIHRSSPRAGGPFVAVNCATLSPTLLQSELFGHEKGAFTGAIARRIGKLEAAEGGTLFLDEVGEIAPEIQAQLLRVLQERCFERVGGTRPIRADLRVIAATNRDLEAAIHNGSFRSDLYYRLKVITLETPPLRQRRGDIPLLAAHFLTVHGRRLGRRGVALSAAARRSLAAYDWPGNVRELGNAIERALVLGDGDTLGPADLPDEVALGGGEIPGELHAAIVETKSKLILRTFRDTGGDYAATAEHLGVHVNSLHRMIARLGLKGRLKE